MPDRKEGQMVGVQFDPLTLKRIAHQAERTQGSLKGNVQSYIRHCVMQQLERDEQYEQTEIHPEEKLK